MIKSTPVISSLSLAEINTMSFNMDDSTEAEIKRLYRKVLAA